MANKSLFATGRRIKSTDTFNDAGGKAYSMTDAEALCQLVVTSTFSDAYYTTGAEQLQAVQSVCNNVKPELVAKAAVYGHQEGKMKDAPAYLLAHLTAIGRMDLVRAIFDRVITNPKMLLNYVQIIRSGATGRRSFGSAAKGLINNWITSRSGNKLFSAAKGKSNPSLVDVIKMTHPRPTNKEQNALFGYLLEKDHTFGDLPQLVKDFENFKSDNGSPLPNMDWRTLTNFNLTKEHWKQISENMPWNTLRMNLNMLQKNGVFDNASNVSNVAARIADANEVRKWNAFPYQLLTTYQNVEGVPTKIKNALQDAMEVATENVPVLGNRVAVLVDVSGSMGSSITGYRKGGVASKTSCRDVAALIASSIARTNEEADVVSFGTNARLVPNFNSRDTVMTNSSKLMDEAYYVGHGTNMSAGMQVLVDSGKTYDFVVVLSDMQTWADRNYGYGQGTSTSKLWSRLKSRNKNAKIATVNIQGYTSVQLDSHDKSVLNIGGWSDQIFTVLKQFVDRNDNVSFVDVVNKVELNPTF